MKKVGVGFYKKKKKEKKHGAARSRKERYRRGKPRMCLLVLERLTSSGC